MFVTILSTLLDTHIDGLNTLMVPLIGHHLSMMKLSTDYQRWNVIRCLIGSQPAIKLLSSGKAAGADAIPAEIYKAGSPPVAEKLTELFHMMWRKEAIPQEFKDATIIHPFKRKGNPQVCEKHRGISYGQLLERSLLGSY